MKLETNAAKQSKSRRSIEKKPWTGSLQSNKKKVDAIDYPGLLHYHLNYASFLAVNITFPSLWFDFLKLSRALALSNLKVRTLLTKIFPNITVHHRQLLRFLIRLDWFSRTTSNNHNLQGFPSRSSETEHSKTPQHTRAANGFCGFCFQSVDLNPIRFVLLLPNSPTEIL